MIDDGIVDELHEDLEDASSMTNNFMTKLHSLLLYMQLSDPQVSLTLIDDDTFDYHYFAKDKFYCVDGFAQEGMLCMIVLDAPKRDGYAYQSLRKGVLMVDDDDITDDIRQIADDNQRAAAMQSDKK